MEPWGGEKSMRTSLPRTA